MSAAAEKVKHYGFALATVYMCYFTYGIQALILSQNKVNFYTQWGITDPTAGSAAVSMAIDAMGFGKLLSVWIGGELSDRVGRKKFAVAGAVAYIICFTMMLLATDATACYIAAFLSGVATSGFWDAALYPAAQEAEPKYAASGVIGIKAAVSVMGVIYPIFVAAFSAPHIWHVNIYLPIVLSVVCLIMTIITPFRYDDERASKTDGDNGMDEAQAEIQAAKDAMLKKPGVLVQVFTLVMAFICISDYVRRTAVHQGIRHGQPWPRRNGRCRSCLHLHRGLYYRCVLLGSNIRQLAGTAEGSRSTSPSPLWPWLWCWLFPMLPSCTLLSHCSASSLLAALCRRAWLFARITAPVLRVATPECT